MALGPAFDNRPLELGPGKQLQHLTENAGYSYHGGGSPASAHVISTQTVAKFYRRSNANLDKSETDG